MKLINGDQFEITEEEMKQLDGKTGLIHFKSLNGIINLTSISCIMPSSKANINRLPLHDGGFAIKKGGAWIDERSGSKIDLSYYPYLSQGKTKEEYDNAKLLN